MKAYDFRRKAREDLNGNKGLFVLIFVIYSTLISIASMTGFGTLIVTGPLILGISICCLKLIRKEEVKVENLFSGFTENFVTSFVAYALNSIFIALWTLLFVIPGLIKSYSYSMTFYVLKDNPKLTATEARKESMRLMDGNKWRLFCLDFSFIGWILLSILTLGILLLWVEPYMEVAHAEFYEEIKADKKI